MPVEHEMKNANSERVAPESREAASSGESASNALRQETPYGNMPESLRSAGTESGTEAKLEVPNLKSVREFTREMAEQRQTVNIAGIEHRYVEGKGYVTDGAPNLLNPPGSYMKNLGGNGPSGGYGNPGPFAFVQTVKVGEGSSARQADLVLPIPAYNPNPETWGKEVHSRFPNSPAYNELPPGEKVEPIDPAKFESAPLPADAINLTKGYPSEMGGLLGEWFNQPSDSRAEKTNLAGAELPAGAKLFNLRNQADVDVVGVVKNSVLELVDHPFNGQLAGQKIEFDSSEIKAVKAAEGSYKHIPSDLYKSGSEAMKARSLTKESREAETKARLAKGGGAALGALILGSAAIDAFMNKSQAKESLPLPSFEITGK